MKIAISVGHHPKSPGYKIGNISEYSEMSPVAGYLIQALQYAGHQAYLIQSHKLDVKVSQINNLNVDCAVELHLNAGGGLGLETLYCPGSVAGKSLAELVHKSMAGFLGSRDRGVKEGWYRMNKANGADFFLKATNCPAVITEAYFLDNLDERERYVGNTHFYFSIANKIAVGIIDYLRQVEA